MRDYSVSRNKTKHAKYPDVNRICELNELDLLKITQKTLHFYPDTRNSYIWITNKKQQNYS